MNESLDDIIAGYTGKQEPERLAYVDRGTHRVVTDPNTELLRQIVMELRCMRGELEQLRRDMPYVRAGMAPVSYRQLMEEEMRRVNQGIGIRQFLPQTYRAG